MSSKQKQGSGWTIAGGTLVLLAMALVAWGSFAAAGELPRELKGWAKSGGADRPRPQPPANPKVYGRTIGEWSAEWWNWALQFPSEISLLLAEGDTDCSLGNSGKVWFLAGNFGGTSERSCTVGAGKALFFPILNVVFWGPEDVPACDACPIDSDPDDCPVECAADLRALAKEATDAGVVRSCTVDGVPCVYSHQIIRTQSPSFVLSLPEGGLLEEFGIETGDRPVAIADGLWVMLPALPRGEHEVRFAGEDVVTGFAVDVTFHLTVGNQ